MNVATCAVTSDYPIKTSTLTRFLELQLKILVENHAVEREREYRIEKEDPGQS